MRHSTLLTEFTDISQRLEYLVAHSSQMVFITGEDAAVQQGFVEAFLGQQSAVANVAFLTARKGKGENYYRQQLSEQLELKTARGKPLAQLFAAREDKFQPVIIAITSAEYIPEDVLRELWDLVLQNRFTRNNEQINILMFGEHEWAEEVKTWLPTNNNDKPVLLTTQTLEYNEETEVEGDLDEMIANRRKQFQQRMLTRAQNNENTPSLLHNWWFRLVLAALFVVSFSSIMIWQYFDVTTTAASEFAQFLFQADSADSEADDADLQVNSGTEDSTAAIERDINQRVAANFNAAMKQLDDFEAQQASIEEAGVEQEKPVATGFSQNSPDSPDAEYIAKISAEQLIQLRDQGQSINSNMTTLAAGVSSSGTQQQSLTLAITAAMNELDALAFDDNKQSRVGASVGQPGLSPANSNLPQPRQSTPAQLQTQVEQSAQSRLTQERTPNREANGAVDYQITDNAPVQSQQPGESDVSPSAGQPLQQSVSSQSSIVGPSQSESLYQYHEDVLLAQPASSYVLQISGITTAALLEEFLVDNRLLNSVWVYKTQRYGGDWFVVLYNQSFATLPQARQAVALLSDKLQAVSPFAKSVQQVRQEILQSPVN